MQVGPVRDQTAWMLDILADPAQHRRRHRDHARGDAGHRDASSWSPGCATETDVAARRGRRQPGAARAVQPRRGGGVRARCASRSPRPRSPAAVGGRRRRRCSTPPSSRSTLRRTRAAHLARLRAGLGGRRRCSTCRTCSPRTHGLRATAAGRRGARRGAGVLMRRPPVGPRPGRLARAAARGQGDRGLLRLGRRRQDDDRGGRRRRWRPPTSAARCSCSPSTRPGASPTRSASSGSATSRRQVPPELFAAAGVEPRGELWAAMLDTKQSWDDLVPPPRARRRDPRRASSTTRCTTTSPAGSCRATTTSRWSGSTRSTRRGRYDLIVVDTPPTRNAIDFLEAPARMADFFGGRLLRWLTVPYRVAAVQRWRRKPFYQMADRILGSQFLQDIAEFFLLLPDDVRRLRRAGPRRSSRTLARPAHDVRGRHHARGRAAARGRVLLRGAARARASTSARSCSTRCCPTGFGARDAAPGRAARSARGGRASRRRWSRPTGRRRRGPGRPGAARGGRELPQLRRSSRPARPSCAPSSAAWPRRRRDACRASTHDIARPRRPARALGERTLAPSAPIAARDRCRLGSMATLAELARHAHRARSRRRRATSQRLVARWRLLADLCFADLLLLAPVAGEDGQPLRRARPGPPDHRPDALPGRLVGTRASTRWSGRCVARACAHGRDRRGRRSTVLGVERAGARAVHPGAAATARSSRVLTRESRADARAASPGELERTYRRRLRPLRPHDRRGHVPVRPRRGRDRGGAPRSATA